MTRRRFAFWLGFGLFTVAERLRADGLDTLAAATMRRTEPKKAPRNSPEPVHWSIAADETFRWYERENFIDGEWMLTGATTPINLKTGKRQESVGVYLDDSLVPAEVRRGQRRNAKVVADVIAKQGHQLPTASRRSRHGRPPSKWLRSLHTDEIRIWLDTIEVPEAGVEGMTYFEHLTQHHSFDPERIEGLTDTELAKLHAAAHYGY
jgi:hypothetical protein